MITYQQIVGSKQDPIEVALTAATPAVVNHGLGQAPVMVLGVLKGSGAGGLLNYDRALATATQFTIEASVTGTYILLPIGGRFV